MLTSSHSLPRASLAGVLVLLCRNDAGGLSVILTTRALTMRSFPGETALPGGRMEEQDASIAATALREAEEEIALTAATRVIATLPPFLSKNLLFVVPVVAFVEQLDTALIQSLKPNAAEVGAIWSWPLHGFLGFPSKKPDEAVEYAFTDVKWLLGRRFRLREFRHPKMASAVTGLTADILLDVALAAYEVSEPGFEYRSPGQMTGPEMIQAVLNGRAGKEGDERSSLRGQKVKETVIPAAIK